MGKCEEGSTAPSSAPNTELRPVLVDHMDIRLVSCVALIKAFWSSLEECVVERANS